MKTDFTYCTGNRCALRDHCVRYINGLKAEDGECADTWWMNDCGEERGAYISNEMETFTDTRKSQKHQ